MWERRTRTTQAGAYLSLGGRHVTPHGSSFSIQHIQLLRGPSRLSIQHRSHGGLWCDTFDDVHAMYSPLSSTIWSLSAITPCVVLKVPEIIAQFFSSRFFYRIYHMRRRCHNWVSGGLEAAAKQTTVVQSNNQRLLMATSWIGQPTLWMKMTHSKDSPKRSLAFINQIWSKIFLNRLDSRSWDH